MPAEPQPIKSPQRQPSTARPPTHPLRPPSQPPPPTPIPTAPSSYGAASPFLTPFVTPQSSLTFAQNGQIHPSSYPPASPLTPTLPPTPLARVPSQPSLRPLLQIDFDQVAEELNRFQGASVTGQDLKNSLPATQGSFDVASTIPTPRDSISVSGTVTPSVPMSVEVAHSDRPSPYTNEQAMVLKIRAAEEALRSPDVSWSQLDTDLIPDASKGFAMSFPVNPEPLSIADPNGVDYQQPVDEESPLLDHQGINLAPSMQLPSDSTVIVQRHGHKHAVKEQEVVVSVPHAGSVGQNTGLLIPNFDSRDNLKELLMVVPPDQEEAEAEPPRKLEETVSTTKETARDAIEQISNMMPSLVDVESTVQVSGSASNVTVAMNVKREVSLVGYVILAVALFSVASQGTAVKWLPSVDGMIAATWLMQCQTFLMVPFAVFQYLTLSNDERRQWKELSTMRMIVIASLSQVVWACGFFLAIDYTSLFHAWSLNNIHALTIVLIAVGSGILRRKNARVVSIGELQGARIAIVGVILMQIPNIVSLDVRSLCGDLIAATSSLGAIMFLNVCKELRQRIPLFLMITPISALNSVTFSMASMVIGGTDFSMTDHGALGWMQADRLILGLYLGGVVGFLGTVCCIAALKYLPSVVVGSVQTMMPVVGTLVAVMMGTDRLPDLFTTLGGGVLLYGVLVIADATRQSEVTVVLNDHIAADCPS